MDVLLDPVPPLSPVVARRLSRIFPGLSHELCRPLISLRVGCDLLLAGVEGPVSEEQRAYIRALRLQCDDLVRLTRAYLLDYAGLATAGTPLAWATFRLGALVEEADRQFGAVATARGVGWSCRLEGADGGVSTDLACFQKLLARLVENALTHTPAGAKVAVLARTDGDRWRVTVVDEGPGIPAAEMDRVLQPLVRLSMGARTGDGTVGHGMGLPICRELVTRLGGMLSLASRVGEGMSATVEFPVDRPADPA